MTTEYEDRIEQAARGLKTEISPERDLWPAINDAITTPQRSRWTPMLAQAAAVILLMGGASTITYMTVKSDVQPVTAVAPNLMFKQASFGNHNIGPKFQDARAGLAAELDAELARLSPQARADVGENLDIIHQAIVDIDTALAQDPGNTMLQQKLLQAYREELSMLRRVSTLTRNVMVRNDI